MDVREVELLGDDVARHWYYRAKGAMVLRLLRARPPRRILDVGAGSGFFSRHLLAHTEARHACCVDPAYQTEHEERIGGKTLEFRRAIETSDADTVLLMDVLEHVDDDTALLARIVELAPAGARFAVTVPAFAFLWSAHDEFLGHRRRYTLSALAGLARRAGLAERECHYGYAPVFPLVLALRMGERLFRPAGRAPRSQLRRHGPVVNETLAALCALERPLMRYNRLCGLSVLGLFEKP